MKSREIRDVIHGFVLFSPIECALIDSAPFQRLRHIHQLSLEDQVYPGAAHTRFEHSIGTMDVASRIFDAVMARDWSDEFGLFASFRENKSRWRSILRCAALLHDVGHLPFSHAAEKALLPRGWDHERLTALVIRSSELANLVRAGDMSVEEVIAVAVPKYAPAETKDKGNLTLWLALLAEMISGPLGSDRIDYLLRDSYHSGVTYGLFDPDRIISGLEVVSKDGLPRLGIRESSLHNAEALMLARYYMYSQVYLHKHRRIYDIHLLEFLKEWLVNGQFSIKVEEFLSISDVEIYSAIRQACSQPKAPLHELALRVLGRRHFRPVVTATWTDLKNEGQLFKSLEKWAINNYGQENIRTDEMRLPPKEQDFPVVLESGRFESSLVQSDVIRSIPPIEFGCIYVHDKFASQARKSISLRREELRSSLQKKKKSVREEAKLPLD